MKHHRIWILLAFAMVVALALVACGGPSNGGGGGGGQTPTPVPSQNPGGDSEPDHNPNGNTPQVFRFEFYGEYDGTVYMDVTQTLPWYLDRTHADTLIAGDLPGTQLPPRTAECFTFYEGKFYYLCPFDYSDGSAVANVPLYVANADGSNPKVLIKAVAAETNPVLRGGILYYERFVLDEAPEGEGYDYEADDGGHVTGGWDGGRELHAYTLATGEDVLLLATDGIDGLRPMLIGASHDNLVVLGSTQSDPASGAVEFRVEHVTFEGAVINSFTVKTEDDSYGSILGVDETGNIVVESKYAYDDRFVDIYSKTGENLLHLHTRVAAFFAPTLVYYDDDGWQRAYHTTHDPYPTDVNMDPHIITVPERVCLQIVYYGAEPLAGDSILYEFCQHWYGVGTFVDVLTDVDNYSVFAYPGHEADDWSAGEGWDGQGPASRRVLPYTTVEWRSTGSDWKSAGSYVFEWGDIDFYSYEQLATMTDEELFYARSELFWRHGYDFVIGKNEPALQKFFKAKTWPQDLVDENFSQAELWNLKLIRQIEADRNSPYKDRGFNGAN